MGVLHMDVQRGRANVSVAAKAFHRGATIPRDPDTVNGKSEIRLPRDLIAVREETGRICLA